MNELPLQFETYYEKQLAIANRFTHIRKRKKVSQKRLSELSGVSYASIRRFENTGDISLCSLVKIAMALQLYDDLDKLFEMKRVYTSIEDVINDQEN